MYLLYYYTVIAVSVISLFLHAIGFYAICSQKKKTNQKITLISLSTVATIISLYRITFELLLYNSHDTLHNSPWFRCVFLSVFYITVYAGLFTMALLAIDRFVCAWNPLLYAVRMSTERTTVLLLVFWIFSLCIGVVTGVAPIKMRGALNMFGGVLACIYLLMTTFTYIVIFRQLKKSRQQFHQQHTTSHSTIPISRSVTFRKEFLVPSILISTFILSYIVPLVITLVLQVEGGEWERRQQSVVYCLCMFVPHIGVAMDAVTYIFFVKQYRNNIVMLWRKTHACFNPVPIEPIVSRVVDR